YDRSNVRHDRYQVDSASVALVLGAPAATSADAVRPDVGDDLLIADVLVPAQGAWGAADTTRPNRLTRGLGGIERLALSLSEAASQRRAGAPDSLTVALATDGSPTLSWWWPQDSGGEQVTAFHVTETRNGVTTVLSDFLRALTIEPAQIMPGESVCWTVESINITGRGAGAEVGAAISGQPDAVSSLTGDPRAGAVLLSWVAPSGPQIVTGYRIESRRTDDPGGWSTLISSHPNTNYLAAGTSGVSYTFRVTPLSSGGDGTSSEVVATPAALPRAPSPAAATGLQHYVPAPADNPNPQFPNSIWGRWINPERATGYLLDAHLEGESVHGGGGTVALGDDGDTTALIDLRSSDVNYYVRWRVGHRHTRPGYTSSPTVWSAWADLPNP
ncbi:MAG: fibronectin type III domain-containing protein, partial [Spirochaetaceae bacterium]|nr:fibronectin type III domain-containing protein [Spirochaetaceae bacterium]